MNIREITISDYEKLIPFWKANYFVNEMDSKDRFKLFLENNPSLSVLAEDGGIIVGTALGSFDGRRGYLQKVVVDRSQRKKGIGQQLVKKIIKKLQLLRATYIPISVEEENTRFYENCGFKKTTQVPMNIEIPVPSIS
ncbi:MAG: GNAT family N-acetyltransferase [bacterium]